MQADLQKLAEALAIFAAERDWDQFHSPKNLSMALAVEAGELLEQFQWLTQEQSIILSDSKREAVEQEIADVLIYLVRLCDRLGVDPVQAAWKKMELNKAKYPSQQVKGSARKYSDYAEQEPH